MHIGHRATVPGVYDDAVLIIRMTVAGYSISFDEHRVDGTKGPALCVELNTSRRVAANQVVANANVVARADINAVVKVSIGTTNEKAASSVAA